tara:strand:- start:8785 stop:8982 length:198 start_codon:yes stop_codon:yes gene_type:complete
MMVDVVEAVLDWRNTTLILDETIVEGSWVFDEEARATLIQLIEDSKKKLRDMKFFLKPFQKIDTK